MPKQRYRRRSRQTNPLDLNAASDLRGMTQELGRTKKLMGEVNGMAQSMQTMIPQLSHSLRDLGTGAKSTGQLFSGVARSILADMDRIAYRRSRSAMRGPLPSMVGSLMGPTYSRWGGFGSALSRVTPMANGGVFDRPTLGLIAERPGLKEAVVPLPDGRSIPVKEVGPKSGGGGQRPLSIVNVIDPRMIQSVVARYLSENNEVVLNMINESARTQGITNSGRF